MFRRKVGEREGIKDELDRQGIDYIPVIWSNFGKSHTAADQVITAIAKRVARRRGHVKPTVVARRIHKDVGTEIARRAARMSLACWPRPES